MADDVYHIPLFADLTTEQLNWLQEVSTECWLETGEYLFKQGDEDDHFYIVLEGALQIIRLIHGVQRVLDVTGRGTISGELALLRSVPRAATARAVAPTHLMVFDSQAFRAIFADMPVLGFRILQIAAERLSGNASLVNHDEKMAALGKFSAGLAHELNNPASAARRAAQTLQDLLPDLLRRSARLCLLAMDDSRIEHLLAVEHDYAERARQAAPLAPLARSDREDELTDRLSALGVEDSYDCAAVFVSSGLTLSDVDAFVRDAPAAAAAEIIGWLSAALNADSLLREIDDSTTRISDLVRTVKEYTYMDQDREQQVDIHKSLETTLKILAHKLSGVEVLREYDPDLPVITANGSELNQVWTNLIDNAVDALKGKPNGRITLVTRGESDFVMVAVEDNGAGIPNEALPRLFEPFFTTKGVGEGTGLGLDISYRIISQHNGSIEVESQPGSTQFIVRLPVRRGAAISSEAEG